MKERLTVADAKKALGRDLYARVHEADAIMYTWREILENEGVDVQEHRINMILGCADMSLVACTLNIKVAGEKVYKTIQGMAHDFICIACGVLRKTIDSPWKAWEEVDTSQPAQAVNTSSSSTLREINKDGTVHPEVVLKEAGFEVGAPVKRKADNVLGTLQAVDAAGVVKILTGGKVAKTELTAFLDGQWVKYVPKPDAVAMEPSDFKAQRPLKQMEWSIFMAKTKIAMALDTLETKFDAQNYDKLKVRIKPSKCLEATAAIPEKKVVLVPCTTNIKWKKDKPEDSSIAVATVKGIPGYFILTSQFALPKDGEPGFMPLYWLVTTSHKGSECNMSSVVQKAGDVEISVFQNSCALAQGEKLVRFVVKKAAPAPTLEYSPVKRQRMSQKGSENRS